MEIIVILSLILFMVSFVAMRSYLWHAGEFTVFEIRLEPLWPKLMFKYRDYTKKVSGKIGVWYTIMKISSCIFSVSLIAVIVPILKGLPTMISVVVLIAAAYIILALGYAIYGLSKEKYF